MEKRRPRQPLIWVLAPRGGACLLTTALAFLVSRGGGGGSRTRRKEIPLPRPLWAMVGAGVLEEGGDRGRKDDKRRWIAMWTLRIEISNDGVGFGSKYTYYDMS